MKAGGRNTKLGDLIDIQNGYAFSSKDYSESGHFLMRIGNVQSGQITLTDPKFVQLPASGSLQRFVLAEGDLLVSLTGYVGRVAEVCEEHLPAALNQRVAKVTLKPQSQVNKKYLLHFLGSDLFLNPLVAAGHGAAQQNVSTKDIVAIEMPIPSPEAQHRIVAILDEAFDGIATAKANAEKNLQNTRALFESHLQSVFTEQGEGWVTKSLNSLAEFSQGIQVGLGDQVKEPSEGFVRFIRIIDYTQGTDDIRYVKNPGRKYWADKTDIVMVRYGTPGLIGRGIEGVIANNLFKISILDKQLTNDFLAYFLSQRSVQGYLRNQGALAMPAITFKQLGGVEVTYPTETTKQNSIVSLLDSINDEIQRLESLYQQKLTTLDDLKKSLLHQAFSGAL